ncbi:hypothetical protein HKX42_03420 [Salinisphaera sp. USBA-960]|uniref:hypothetical protein n=1 Tax=Salinisphaera orenii TaxID=856731 RepID=UPI0013A610F8|nr:hypothetical protein [Salifodinibacter halophilus]NNC25927.1 hypothetical protein [Salifodinibacter halophilus]
MAVAAYLCWVASTAIGGAIGAAIQDAAPAITQALHFALPALFLALSLENLNRDTAWPLLAGAASALGAIFVSNIVGALFAAIAASVAVSRWCHQRPAP